MNMGRQTTSKILANSTDVTDQVEYLGPLSAGFIMLTKCVCGHEWREFEGPVVDVFNCPRGVCGECGREFFLQHLIVVREI